MAGQEAAVEQRVVIVPIDQRRRIVGAGLRVKPGYVRVSAAPSFGLMSPEAPGLIANAGRIWSPT